MGKWIHKLTNINKEERTGTCANCGTVKLKRYNENRYCCINSVKRYYKRGSGDWFKENPLKEGQTCEICNGTKKIYYDHNHQNGKFRGWLCQSCNSMLGFAKDDITILQKAIGYLSK